jgi:hypothetical protein
MKAGITAQNPVFQAWPGMGKISPPLSKATHAPVMSYKQALEIKRRYREHQPVSPDLVTAAEFVVQETRRKAKAAQEERLKT